MKRGMTLSLLFGVITAGGFASESDGIFTFKLGKLEISMMVESQRDGNAGILVGADPATIKRYIPESGFKHTANAFLIKAPGRNIVVDTGTGAGGIIIDKLKKLGVEPEQVDAVLITHLHGDHFGSLQKDGKAVFTKAQVYVASRERDFFTKTNVNQGAVAALSPYGSRVVAFEPGELGKNTSDLVPGIKPFAAYGHTPGHTVFLVEDSGQKFLIAGDFLHVALVQFPLPEISASYDIDPKAAATTRRQIMDYAAKNKIPVGGMHIVYPGVGMVEIAGEGFRFVPMK
ncbi:MAG: MBL fold metallo-hydrolase [Treponema sp.]|nr:MBL fold metallo-hydrolase [Treponema sp.]